MIFRTVILAVIFSFNNVCAFSEINEEQYALMPDLFLLDDYDKCMTLQDRALYCTITFQLEPKDKENPSEIWNIIKFVSSAPSNYRHDNLRHGICVPTLCPNASNINIQDRSEVIQIINQCYKEKYENLGLDGNLTEIECLTNHNLYEIDIYDIIVAVVLLSYVTFVICFTIADTKTKKKSNILSAFSISKNWKRLTKVDNNQELRCMGGIKFFNMVFVILAHSMLAAFAGGVFNPEFTENMTKYTFNMFIVNGTYIIQSFFVISAWLLSYHIFTKIEQKKFTLQYLPLIFVNRYIRLTPVLLVVLAFNATWLVHLPRGPQWIKAVQWEYFYCRKNWWTNLLYVNNYVDKEHMCMEHTWYLAADTQLFLVSLIVLAIVFKIKKYTKFILATFLAVGVFLPGIVSWVTNSDILTRLYPENLYLLLLETENFHTLYTSAYSNIGGYALGILCGYIYYKTKDKKIKFTQAHKILWWILTFGFGIFVILIAGIMYKDDFIYTKFEAALYWALGKNVFAFAIAIFIFGLTRNLGGYIGKIVELDTVQILSRLTYSVYIVHPTLFKYKLGIVRTTSYISYYTIVQNFFTDFCLSYLLGLLLCLFFEMPISALQKKLIPQMNQNSKSQIFAKNTFKINEEQELGTNV